MFTRLLLEKVSRSRCWEVWGAECLGMDLGERKCKWARLVEREVRLWRRLEKGSADPMRSSGWNPHACHGCPMVGSGLSTFSWFVTWYGIPWRGCLLGKDGFCCWRPKKDLGGIFHCSYLTLSEHICQVVMLIEFTCQDILLIKWIILHKVLCTGVGSQGKLLMYTTWGWWYWWQGLEFLNWQESWSSWRSVVCSALHVSESLGSLVKTQV